MVSKPQSADLSPSLRTQRGKPSSRRGSVDCGDTAFNCVKPEIVTWMGHGSRPLRECTIFSNNFKLICPVQPRPQKYSASRETQITPTTPAIRPEKRGVGHRHERWGGLRWTRQRRAREVFAGRASVSEHRAQTNGA